MQYSVKEYDAKLDSKKRLTLRSGTYEYYHVSEMADGRIILEPRVLTAPFTLSANSLAMMDSAVQNLKTGNISDSIDLSEFGA